MRTSNLLLTAAIAGLMTAGLSVTASAEDAAAGKCYGIAKVGQNACANAMGTHACKGQAKIDNDAGDFVLATPADCAKEGGKASAPAK